MDASTHTEDTIIALAERLEAMPKFGRIELPARPGKQRAVKVERCGRETGASHPVGPEGWAAWNIGSDNGLVFQDSLDMAACIIKAYEG